MKNLMRWMTLGFALVFAFGITACGSGSTQTSDTTEDAPVTATVSPSEDESGEETGDVADDNAESEDEDYGLMINEEEILAYGDITYIYAYDADGDITWSCSDPDVIEMEEFDEDNSSVMITGIKPGKAIITASTESQGEVTCNVTVYSVGLYLQDDRGNRAAHSTGTYAKGKSHIYTAYVDGEEVASSDLTWASMNEDVATVESDGTVTMVDEGITYITATDADGNTAYASVWVSDTDDEWEYETTTPSHGIYFDGALLGFEEYVLGHYEGEGTYYSIYTVYDDGEEIDASTLEWSVEDIEGEPFEIAADDEENEDPDPHVSITYSGEAGKAFLVATNPATGHTYKYLIVVFDVE